MTSPSLRNHRTIPLNTLRRNPSNRGGRLRSGACLLLAIGLVVAGSGSVDAGKKKRNSLELLRQRSAAERWHKLQEQWQLVPETTGDLSHPGEVSNTSATGEQPAGAKTHSPSPAERREASDYVPAAEFPGRTPGLPDPTTQEKTPVEQPWILQPREPQTASKATDIRPASTITQYRQSEGAVPPENSQLVPLPMTESQRQRQELDNARPKPISSILPYYDYSPEGEHPCEVLCPRPADCPEDTGRLPCPELVGLPDIPFESRSFAESHVMWEASNLFSNPLYFEDAPLERYGHTHGPILQPLVSVGKFGVQLVGLPYQMALHPIHEQRYTLGWYRPGEPAPYKYYLPPWNTKAAVTAGAVYTGLFFLIP